MKSTANGTSSHGDHYGDRNVNRLHSLTARIPSAGRQALTSNIQHLTSRPAWDAAGNRITFQSSTRANDSDTCTFVYDPTAGIPAVIEETTPPGATSTTTRYIREPGGELIARVSTVGATETTHYYHFDELGSTQFLTDTNGVITDKYTYDAWGNLTSHSGTTQQPYQYIGKYGYYAHTQDANVVCSQTGIRFYNSELGRYQQEDILQEDVNVYGYARQTPTTYMDYTGMFATCDIVDNKTNGICQFYSVKSGRLLRTVNVRDHRHFDGCLGKCCSFLSVLNGQLSCEVNGNKALCGIGLTLNGLGIPHTQYLKVLPYILKMPNLKAKAGERRVCSLNATVIIKTYWYK